MVGSVTVTIMGMFSLTVLIVTAVALYCIFGSDMHVPPDAQDSQMRLCNPYQWYLK